MSRHNRKQGRGGESKIIDITADDRPYHNPVNERQLAHQVLESFAEHASKASGWHNFRVYDEIPYDDTDGSGCHPNRPGVDATVEATAPSGQVYRAMMSINEEAHHPIDRGDDDYALEDFDEDSLFGDPTDYYDRFWDYP